MSTLYFDPNDRLDTIVTRVREAPDSDLTLFIPENSSFHQNELNKKILQKIAAEAGKTVKFGDKDKTQEQPETAESTPLSATGRADGRSQPSSPSQPIESASGGPPIPPKPPARRISNLKLFTILIGIFGLFAVGAAAFILLYLPKTEIILFVEEKILQEQETVVISPDIAEISFADKKIPGKVLSVTEEEKKNFSATGKKTIGEKATGKVTLQNWTDEDTLLQARSKVAVVKGDSGEGLSFTLDSGIPVPAQTFSVPAPGQKLYEAGTAEISVTAEDIGEKYNLSANTSFTIEGFAYKDFSSTNGTAFSGGLTREVIIVAEEDQDKAQEELKAKLLAQGKEDLQSKVLGDQKLLEEIIAGDVLGTNFSHKIGDEVGSFEVALKTQSTATVYSESQLKELAGKILEESVPEGYKISSKDLGVAISSIERKSGGGLSFAGTFKTLVIPVFSEESLIEELSGKRALAAGEIIENIPHVQGWNITFWPRMPIFLQILPLNSERIKVKVETQK